MQTRLSTTIACILFVTAANLAAADSASFLIESIQIRGVQQASPDIVLAESLLSSGGVYTEHQLRDAEVRLRRLPFVFDVEMRIERGSTPGIYVLAIQIVETKPWFFGFAADPREAGDAFLVAGRRWFVRRNGVVHAAATSDRTGSLEAGYTMYDLFNRAAVLSLNLRFPVGEVGQGVTTGGPSPELTFILPLNHRQALRLRYEISFLTVEDGPSTSHEAQTQRLEAMWQYRSVDDPFFPRHGSDIESGLRFFDSTVGAFAPQTTWPPEPGDTTYIHARRQGAAVSIGGHRYFDLGRQISLGGGASASAGRQWSDHDGIASPSLFDYRYAQGNLEASISGSLWSEEKAQQRGPFRWEASVGMSSERVRRPVPADALPRDEVNSYHFRAGIGRRNAWGIYRFVASYTRLGR